MEVDFCRRLGTVDGVAAGISFLSSSPFPFVQAVMVEEDATSGKRAQKTTPGGSFPSPFPPSLFFREINRTVF